MNWKQAAQQQLRSYPALLIAVENLTRELSLPSDPAAVTGQNSSGEPEHSGALSRQELTDALQRTKIRIENIRQALNVLSPEEQEILSTLYFARKTGAVFDLYADSNGNQKLDKEDEHLGTLQELTGGIYQMNDLLYGGYFIKEKTAPQGFYLDDNAYYFQITENGKTVIVENEAGKGFINNAQRGSIRIEKTSEDKVVKGFTFKVEGTDITGQPYSQTFVTDEKGEIHIEELRIGTYVISEVSNDANKKYELPPDVTVTVLEGKTTVAKFYNKLIPEIPDIPKTGDETNTTLWGVISLVALAGAGITGFLFYRDTKRKDGKK